MFNWCSNFRLFGKKQRIAPKCPENFIKILTETTSLKSGQIIYLYKCFCHMAKETDVFPPTYLKKSNFLTLASLQRNPILSTLLTSIFGDRKQIDFIAFAKYLSKFQAVAANLDPLQLQELKQKKLKMLFNMYDIDKNGIITIEDLIFIVHKLFADIWTPEQIVKVATMMLSEMDTSLNDQILFDDFCQAWNFFDVEDDLIINIPKS